VADETWQSRPVKKLESPMAPANTNLVARPSRKRVLREPTFQSAVATRLDRIPLTPLFARSSRHNLPIFVGSSRLKLGSPASFDGGVRYSHAENSRWKSNICTLGYATVGSCLRNVLSTSSLASDASFIPSAPKS